MNLNCIGPCSVAVGFLSPVFCLPSWGPKADGFLGRRRNPAETGKTEWTVMLMLEQRIGKVRINGLSGPLRNNDEQKKTA